VLVLALGKVTWLLVEDQPEYVEKLCEDGVPQRARAAGAARGHQLLLEYYLLFLYVERESLLRPEEERGSLRARLREERPACGLHFQGLLA
jgi:hypothetical protein